MRRSHFGSRLSWSLCTGSQITLTLCLLSVTLLSAQPQTKPDNLGSSGALFHRYCAACHGLNANGGRGPELVSGRWSHGGTDADLKQVIANGVPGSDMPAFGYLFKDADYAKLIAYIRWLAAGGGNLRVTGNAKRGREFYWSKGACSSCHMVNGQGGTLGPDLTRIGSQRSTASLKESVVSPSTTIATGYQGVRVIQGDRAITGTRKNEDNYTIQVYDGERFHSFDKTKIDRLEVLHDSLMPRVVFSSGEVDDLVAYMDTLRGIR
jgi:cytochrome c oxidase cbb3-type subunit 3